MKTIGTEPIILMCTDNVAGTEGSAGKCTTCSADVWVSNSSKHALEKQGYSFDDKKMVIILCFICSMPHFLNPETQLNPLTTEQAQEVDLALYDGPKQ